MVRETPTVSDDDELDRLPPAHPGFSKHFTRQCYDPDDYMNDETPPFGSDEGSDEIHDWAERLDELREHPTLRYMIGSEGAEDLIADLATSKQIDVDDILIGQGFTLLRFTGQIDPEGRRWLRDALIRQRRHTGDPTYAHLQTDLDALTD